MSSSDRNRRAAIATLAVALALGTGGCGFHPLYAPPSAGDGADGGADRAVADDLASISISPISNRQGQELRNRLDRLLHTPGTNGSPGKYVLNVALGEFQQSLAIRATGLATRTNLYMSATYNMVDSATGGAVLTGSSVAIASYDLLDQDFATITAINDARTRTLERIAGDIRNRLAVHFATAPTTGTAATVPATAPVVTPPAVFVPSPATEPTIASPFGTAIDLPPASEAPVGPESTRVGGTP
ncbi:MAG: LPS assembly lipoprotein LptE [Rhodospirillales bacterium]